MKRAHPLQLIFMSIIDQETEQHMAGITTTFYLQPFYCHYRDLTLLMYKPTLSTSNVIFDYYYHQSLRQCLGVLQGLPSNNVYI